MKAFVTNRKEQQFFFQYRIYSVIQSCKVGDKKSKSPRTQLFQKIRWLHRIVYDYWRNVSYCENESVDPTPRPVPDINKLPKYHYLPVAETPITNTDDGKRREVDDYHPRARLKQVHKKNEINIEDSASVQTFAKDTLLKKVLWKNT